MRKYTLEEIRAAEAHGEGFCLSCGHRQEAPQTEQPVTQCEDCWEFAVISAEELLENLEIVDIEGSVER